LLLRITIDSISLTREPRRPVERRDEGSTLFTPSHSRVERQVFSTIE